jgi:hypothetical protein
MDVIILVVVVALRRCSSSIKDTEKVVHSSWKDVLRL